MSRPETRSAPRAWRRGTAATVGALTIALTLAGCAGTQPRFASFVPVATVGPARAPGTQIPAKSLPEVRPTRVKVPSIGVDSTLQLLHLDAAGALLPPTDYVHAGWFVGGPLPGDTGPAVIAGHVDSYKGPGVFFRLRLMKVGADIQVLRGTIWLHFKVVAVGSYSKTDFPTAEVYGPTPDAELRLITCGGVFDRSTRNYLNNIVVYAIEV